jgi:hypothetical protein
MGKADEYRRNAASCLQLVDKTGDPAERTFLLDMARAWHNLANQAERNSRTDLVYETPPPRVRPEPQQPVTQQQQQIQPDPPKEEEES